MKAYTLVPFHAVVELQGFSQGQGGGEGEKVRMATIGWCITCKKFLAMNFLDMTARNDPSKALQSCK